MMIDITLFFTISPAVNTDPNSIKCSSINKKLQTDTIWPGRKKIMNKSF